MCIRDRPMFCVVIAFSPEVLTKFGIASCRRCFCKYSRKSRTGTQIHAGHLIKETVLLKRPDQGISKGLFYTRYKMLPYSPNLAIMVNKYCGSSSCLVARTGVSKWILVGGVGNRQLKKDWFEEELIQQESASCSAGQSPDPILKMRFCFWRLLNQIQ